MFHICSEEIIAFLSIVPFIGIGAKRLHFWWHGKFKSKCPNKCTVENNDID